MDPYLITRILEEIGEDPSRDGLRETPDRVVRSYEELFAGYREDPAKHLEKVFEVEHDEIVVVRDIDFFSHCEHHMVPFFGRFHVAYLPSSKGVVGLSKLARVVGGFSRRLQVQERLTTQVAGAIESALEPKGVAVVCDATHLCMVMRGVRSLNAVTTTSVMRGAFRSSEPARLEALKLLGK